jgi:hypothetical protein
MKRSSLAPPPPAKRTRQPGEEGSPNGDDDDGDNIPGLVSSSAAGVSAVPNLTAAPTVTVNIKYNENNHEVSRTVLET